MKTTMTLLFALALAFGATTTALHAGTCGGCKGGSKETSKEKDKSTSTDTETKDKPAKS